LRNLIHSCLQKMVDLFPLGQHVVERNISYHRSQRGRGNPLGGSRKILDLYHAGDGIEDSRDRLGNVRRS
jgi:hypothetical protein